MSYLENTIKQAHDQGYLTFSKIPQIQLYQWLAKIFYGLLFRELSLLTDRSDPSLGSIITEDFLKDFGVMHLFLQSVRLPMIFRGFQPWSIFIVRTLEFGDERDFDYRDILGGLVFSIRMGEIGIIACLEDAGVQQIADETLFEEVSEIRLHPVQFDELVARVLYGTMLRTRSPKFMIHVPDDTAQPFVAVCLPLLGLSSKPMFEEWENREYADVLFQLWQRYGFPFDFIYDGLCEIELTKRWCSPR